MNGIIRNSLRAWTPPIRINYPNSKSNLRTMFTNNKGNLTELMWGMHSLLFCKPVSHILCSYQGIGEELQEVLSPRKTVDLPHSKAPSAVNVLTHPYTHPPPTHAHMHTRTQDSKLNIPKLPQMSHMGVQSVNQSHTRQQQLHQQHPQHQQQQQEQMNHSHINQSQLPHLQEQQQQRLQQQHHSFTSDHPVNESTASQRLQHQQRPQQQHQQQQQQQRRAPAPLSQQSQFNSSFQRGFTQQRWSVSYDEHDVEKMSTQIDSHTQALKKAIMVIEWKPIMAVACYH